MSCYAVFEIVPTSMDTVQAFQKARETERDLYQRKLGGARVISAVPVIGYQKVVCGKFNPIHSSQSR